MPWEQRRATLGEGQQYNPSLRTKRHLSGGQGKITEAVQKSLQTAAIPGPRGAWPTEALGYHPVKRMQQEIFKQGRTGSDLSFERCNDSFFLTLNRLFHQRFLHTVCPQGSAKEEISLFPLDLTPSETSVCIKCEAVNKFLFYQTWARRGLGSFLLGATCPSWKLSGLECVTYIRSVSLSGKASCELTLQVLIKSLQHWKNSLTFTKFFWHTHYTVLRVPFSPVTALHIMFPCAQGGNQHFMDYCEK